MRVDNSEAVTLPGAAASGSATSHRSVVSTEAESGWHPHPRLQAHFSPRWHRAVFSPGRKGAPCLGDIGAPL